MSTYRAVGIGELLKAIGGRAKYIRDYLDANRGDYPVYSASLVRPFGFVNEFDYEGAHLTWVMNGYGGRVQEVQGRFSVTRDRGVFLPREGVRLPDLTYLRFAMEPALTAAAVGRRVDGRLNEYTKIYPEAAESVEISLPIDSLGKFDYDKMQRVGDRLRRIEQAQKAVRDAFTPLARASFVLEVEDPSQTLVLGDKRFFELSIGQRVLRNQHSETGIPVYSANVLLPFGHLSESNLSDFTRPSLLWGIDGNFDWNLIPANQHFATTDHCGRLQLVDAQLDIEYVFCYLQSTRDRYGFDRVFRASMTNLKADVSVTVPVDAAGRPSLERQRHLAEAYQGRIRARQSALTALGDVLHARMTVEL